MSFSEYVARFGEQLARSVDTGVAAKDAAHAVGVDRQRAVRDPARDGPVGRVGGQARPVDEALVLAVFDRTGSINQARMAAAVAFRSTKPRKSPANRMRSCGSLNSARWQARTRFSRPYSQV